MTTNVSSSSLNQRSTKETFTETRSISSNVTDTTNSITHNTTIIQNKNLEMIKPNSSRSLSSSLHHQNSHNFKNESNLNSIHSNKDHIATKNDNQDYSTSLGGYPSLKYLSFSPLKKGEELCFKSAFDVLPSNTPDTSLLFEDKIAVLTDQQSTRNSKEMVLLDDKGDVDMLKNRSNSMDEIVSQIFEEDDLEDSDSVKDFNVTGVEDVTKGVKEKKYLISITIISLMIFVLCSGVLASCPIFTCNNSKGICLSQLKVQLTDKSPAAKTALITVKEALKVLSYLALDFGDTNSDLDMINNSLDSYYQDKVIDTFNVNTIYEINAWGYCRSSLKYVNGLFCMRGYGFDLLSVFVRDAGVQLGELTKTNISLMGDSFAIAYEMAISGFNQLTNIEGNSQDYINWAILLQKFSKGLGFLTMSQFIIDCIILAESTMLLALIHTNIKTLAAKNNIHIMKSILIISMTTLGFINVLAGFLICSLTFEYYMKLTELAQKVGIANVETGNGFILIWIAFVTHAISIWIILFLANNFRKGVY